MSIWASLNARHAHERALKLDPNLTRRLRPATRLVMVQPVNARVADLSRLSDELMRRVYLEAFYRPDAATLRQLARRCATHEHSRTDVLRAACKLRDLGLVRFTVGRI